MADPTQVSRRFLRPDVKASLDKADSSLQASDKQALMDADAAELARATAAEQTLGTRIDNEQSARIAGDQSNASAITTETNRATGVEAQIRNDLTTEITRAEGIESGLRSDLTSEISRAEGIEAGLRTDVNAARAIADAAMPESEKQALIDATAHAQATADAAIPLTQKGAANGVVPLGSNGLIDGAFLPSYVDDVLEVSTISAAPMPGESGKIYVALDTNWEYRWSGSTYIRIVPSPGTTSDVPEGSNLYFTNQRAIDAVTPSQTAAIAVETNRAQSAESNLQTQISNEVTRATGIESGLRSDLTALSSAYQSADTALGTRIDNEVSRATAAESSIQSSVTAETNRATGIESGLRTDVNASVKRAGDTMQGDLSMGVDGGTNFRIKNLASPVNALDAANRQFVLDNGSISKKELFVLAGIAGSAPTNTFLDLAYVAKTDSISFISDGLELTEGSGYDYTVDYTGGANGNTRIKFEPNLIAGGATPLLAGDVVVIKYGR